MRSSKKEIVNFSIILPTYNRADMVVSAIESILIQSYKNWELIIIDDGSKDNTKAAINRFSNNDNIKYIYQDNLGRSTARNNGIEQANGDWICFIDSDDYFHENHLLWLKELIIANKLKKGLYFSGLSYDNYKDSKQFYNLSAKNEFEFILLNMICTGRACISKEGIKEFLFDEKLSVGEDIELWLRMATKYPIYHHSKRSYIQKNHPNRSINFDTKFEHLKTVKLIFSNSEIIVRPIIKRKILSDSYFNIAKYHIKRGKNILVVKYILYSIFINIFNNQTYHKIVLLTLILAQNNHKILKEYR